MKTAYWFRWVIAMAFVSGCGAGRNEKAQTKKIISSKQQSAQVGEKSKDIPEEPSSEPTTKRRKDPRPNILFIYADDHAYQALSAYGSKINKTPNLDRIAKEGMTFHECYVTNSICGPMRAVIQTGKYSHLNGFKVNGDKFNGDQVTLPKLLKKGGYQTAIVGKWHLASTPQGYDHYEVLLGQGPYYNPKLKSEDGIHTHVGYTTKIITDRTLNWLKKDRDPDQPFFLMFQHKAPHREWYPELHRINDYDDVTIPEPQTLFDDYEGRTRAAHEQDMTIAKTMTEHDLKLGHLSV